MLNETVDREPSAEPGKEIFDNDALNPARPLVFLASDDDAVCVDDVCLTPEQRELVEEDGGR